MGLAEGEVRYGFESALDGLMDMRNWNPDVLGAERGSLGEYLFARTPRLSVYKLFTRDGFEVHCIPWLRDKEIDFELVNHKDMEFKHWKPSSMKLVFRIPQLHTFIQMTIENGDEADLQLIRFAHHLAEAFVEDLHNKLNVQKEHGVSVKGFYEYACKRMQDGEEVFLPKVYDLET